MTQESMIEITNLNDFVATLAGWHSNKVARLKHMSDIPETSEVSVGEGPLMQMTGDFRKGYQLGIAISLSELGELPFVAELGEAADAEYKH